MKTLLTLIVFSLLSFHVMAQECTPWTAQSGISCVSAGSMVSSWVRQCENACGWRNVGAHCDNEYICWEENPDNFSGICSEWIPESGVTCQNTVTGNWEQKWIRACQKGVAQEACSKNYPN